LTPQDIIDAFGLPKECFVNQRVPKKLLVENGAPTSSDKRQINDRIELLNWVAALKSSKIGVPDYRDDTREYVEIAIISAIFRKESKATRLIELIHRAIPYPVILITHEIEDDTSLALSFANKRWSQNESGKMVLEDKIIIGEFKSGSVPPEILLCLAIGDQNHTNMLALYHSWIEKLEAFLAATLTDKFSILKSKELAASRHKALSEHELIVRQIEILRNNAKHESQVSRRVQINLELKQLESKLAQVKKMLLHGELNESH
jgi:hypothetical protein